MNLDLIKNNTKWEEAANSINSNFNKTNLELTKIAASSVKHKGYFTTEAALLAAQPSPKVGDNAYVGATYPGVVYICNTAGMWTATTTVPSPPAVNIYEYYKKTETDAIVDAVDNKIVQVETNLNENIQKNTIGNGIKTSNTIIKVIPVSSLFPNTTWSIEIYCYFRDIMSLQFILFSENGYPSIFINSGRITISKAGISNSGHFNIYDLLEKYVHLVITYDGTNHSVKVNNASVEFTIDTNSPYLYSSKHNLYISSYSDGSYPLTADINLVRIYDRVLSDAEISNSYNNGSVLSSKIIKDSSLLLELHGNNISNGKWYDTSINNYIAEVNGTYSLYSKMAPYPIVPTNEEIKVISNENSKGELIKFTNGYSKFTPHSPLFPNTTWSIEIYCYLKDINTVQVLFSSGNLSQLVYINEGRLNVGDGTNSPSYIYISEYLNKKIHIFIIYSGTNTQIYINGVLKSLDYEGVMSYNKSLNDVYIASNVNGIQPFNSDFYFIKIYSNNVSSEFVIEHYNEGFPHLFISPKNENLKLELIARNAVANKWYDTSLNEQISELFGEYEISSNFVQFQKGYETDYLDVIPTNIYLATDIEFNMWYDSIIPFYGKNGLRIDCSCTVGMSMERSFRYTPTSVGSHDLTIRVIDYYGKTIELKVVTLNSVSKTNGSGSPQILFIGDSTTDSYLTDYLCTGRDKYEMLIEFNRLIGIDGGPNPKYIGNNGIYPIYHEGHSGYSTNMFISNNPSYPNPFWDGTRNNYKLWMSNNSYFGGIDSIDYVFIQLGINDLKSSGSPETVLNNYITLINGIKDATYGYPSAKIIISLTPYTAINKNGWAKDFKAISSYESYVDRMITLSKLIVLNFDNNPLYPDVYIAPNMLYIDRKYGYPHIMTNISASTSEQEMQYTDSVHPDTSGYKQMAHSYYSRFKSLL